jgi:Na+/H+-translocating membrane pyrophosphatase
MPDGGACRQVKSQFANDPRLMEGTAPKDVVARGRDRCIAISTEASLREMVYPSALVMLAPLLAGEKRETLASCVAFLRGQDLVPFSFGPTAQVCI